MKTVNLKVGTRGSQLAVAQAHGALEQLRQLFNNFSFELIKIETPGDRDLTSDLKSAPADFFTRDLDRAVQAGEVDLAIHSAKDLPDPMPVGLDWFWLPWREDPRDAWVLAEGRSMADLPCNPTVGVSSERRDLCALKRFPNAILKPIRGSIIARMEQLDRGDYDGVLMAGAALKRLGLEGRITEWIELNELPVPPGQGYLALTFRPDDQRLLRLRSYFVKSVRFAGAGVGSKDYCTWGGIKDLQRADICLYDVLMDDEILGFLPEHAERVFVGKRCGDHCVTQPLITTLIADYARQGKRVVRLKGGDPGLFGRLAEETDELERLSLPYTVRAGVSALTVATTGTGMLLTRRTSSRGFCTLTPRAAGGEVAGVSAEIRTQLPLVLFMSIKIAPAMAAQLLDEGWDEATPIAVVFNAGADDQHILRLSLAQLVQEPAGLECKDPGLLIIGSAAAGMFRSDLGALQGRRVLLTCSEAIMEKAICRVVDFGGRPLPRPLIKLLPCHEIQGRLAELPSYDWLVLTSPAAVRFFMEMVLKSGVDLRHLPKIMTCGPGSARAFAPYGILPDLTPPMIYSAEGLAEVLAEMDFSGQRVLRLRSELAGSLLADVLRGKGALVHDELLYKNEFVHYPELPEFEIVFFASASAVDSYVEQAGAGSLSGKFVLTIGQPTADALVQHGIHCDCVADKATVNGAIESLARCFAMRE
ncbi:MAG: hydroxymethylbilane synthase [Kiritimatiellae bacterium]|nr:hydroxymethylbilane synthase [Kiritimatiellia bacterium]